MEDLDLYADIFSTTEIKSLTSAVSQPPLSTDQNQAPKDSSNIPKDYRKKYYALSSEHERTKKGLEKQEKLVKNATKNFHTLLVTARYEIAKLKEQMSNLKAELHAPYKVTCPKCASRFDSSEQRPPKPQYVKALVSRRVVEMQFRSEEHMKEWLVRTGLSTNPGDDLPTLPEKLIEKKPATLTETKSTLIVVAKGTADQKDREPQPKKRKIDESKIAKRSSRTHHRSEKNSHKKRR